MLCRRTDEEGLRKLTSAIEDEGGTASGFLLGAAAVDSIEERVAAIEADIGPIEVAVYNPGAQIGDRTLADTSHQAFEMGWQTYAVPKPECRVQLAGHTHCPYHH